MSESDKTNELDNYGVWVKKPPRTVSTDESMESSGDTFDIASDLPDFSNLDVVDNTPFDTGDTALSADELSAIADTSEITQSQPEFDSGSSETEEISLDEFIEGGIFEGDDGGSAASERSEAESKAAATETVSEDEFSISDDFAADSAPTVTETSISDDSPLDIDLSFDDAPLATDSTSSSDSMSFETIDSFDSPYSSASSAGDDGTESIDLSDFGFDINAPEGGNEQAESPAAEETASEDGTESVDLSEFGFDINAPEGGNEQAEAEEASSEPAPQESVSEEVSFDDSVPPSGTPDENGMESISLDDFGFDIDAPEGGNETAPAAEETVSEPAESESQFEAGEVDNISFDSSDDDLNLDSLSLDPSSEATPSPELPESDGIEMSVTADDDMEIQESAEEDSPSESFTNEDDDFDLDSIMNSIEDENGDKVSLSSPEDLIKDVDSVSTEAPAEEPVMESIDDLNLTDVPAEEIPDSFDEETASLFGDDGDDTIVEDVVEQSEPVFEETAIDMSEIPMEPASEASGIIEDVSSVTVEDTAAASQDNPFELPPDDAFMTTDDSVTEDSIFEEAATEDIVSTDKDEFQQIEDPFADEQTAFAEEPAAADEPVIENIEAPAETAPAVSEITEGKDKEIADATNDILSKIVSELASLKSEISGLKSELTEIKSKEELPVPAVENDANDEGGFFSGTEEDDTIALSVDELDNILNTVEIVDEQPAEESAQEDTETAEPDGFSFEENAFEETVEDEVVSSEEESTEAEEEIFVPKVDDILVESGSNDLISESTEETEEETLSSDDLSIGNFSFDNDDSDEIQPEAVLSDEMVETIESSETSSDSEPSFDEPFEFGSDTVSEAAEENTAVEESEEDSIEETAVFEDETPSEEDSIAITNDELDNLLAPDPSINDALTAENLNYLASDKELGSASQQEINSSSSIPGNLQKEIKSVLSYMDQLLENLPEEKIAEFAQSEQFETYKKLFKELGLDQ